MTDSIHSIEPARNPIDWSFNDAVKGQPHAADAEVASLYYQNTLTSLAPINTVQNTPQLESVETKKSILGRAKDWLWGIFGWGQPQPAAEMNENDSIEEDDYEDSPLLGGPKLAEPEFDHKKRLSQAITDLNRDLVNRLKDIAEFEEEMRKSGSNKLDKFLFMHLMQSGLRQKELAHSRNFIAQEELFDLHKKNKELHKTQFSLLDSLDSENWTKGILKWCGVGLTAMTVAGSAIVFATGGSALVVFTPIAALGRGATTIFSGILSYSSDRKTGELVVLRHETKTNASGERERLTEMQNLDGEVASLLKKIKSMLDNQTRAERASFGRK